MRVAVMGATGCVGSALLDKLVKTTNYEIVASYRGKSFPIMSQKIQWKKLDLENSSSVEDFLAHSDILIYLIHSLDKAEFQTLDLKYAQTVAESATKAKTKKIIYLGGIIPSGGQVSNHLLSRQQTGVVLATGGTPVTEIRASILLGACSVSYKMIYYLSKRLPFIMASDYLNSFCSPIFIDDMLDVIISLLEKKTQKKHEIFEVGSEIIRYKDLLALSGEVSRGIKNTIFSVPFFPIFLSALLIRFVTGVSFNVSYNLVGSLKNDTNYSHNCFHELTGRDPLAVKDSLKKLAVIMNNK